MTVSDIRWRGPRPLTAGYLLKGRDRELAKLVDVAKNFTVFEITAPSGVGKSSFISAGLIPELRFDMKVVLPGTPSSWGSVLNEYDSHVNQCSEHSADKIDPELIYRLYLGWPPHEDKSIAQHLDAFEGRVVVVLDQFEELIRYRGRLGEAVLSFVGRTATARRVTHIVAARSEYRDQLRPLESAAGDFFHWALEEIDDRHAIEEIVRAPVLDAGLRIQDEATTMLSEWWEAARSGVSDDERSVVPGVNVGLLHLQGVLWHFKDWLEKNDPATSEITVAHLCTFADEVSLGADSPGPEVFRKGLVAYIKAHSRNLHLPIDDRHHWSPAHRGGRQPWTNGPRLMLARSAHLLSVLGYKVAQSRSGMFRSVLADDLDPGLARSLAVRIAHQHRAASDDDQVLAAVALQLGTTAEGDATVRGTGLAAGWSADAVLRELMAAAVQAWESAAGDANILRKFVQSDDDVFELVHDGMGPALQEWALEELDETRAALGVITPRIGQLVAPSLSPATFLQDGAIPHYWEGIADLDTSSSPPRIVLSGLGWDACRITSEMQDVVISDFTLTGALFVGTTLSNVVFRRCELRGAAFHNTVFDGVRFEDCDLHGAAIRWSDHLDVVFEPATGEGTGEPDHKLDLLSFVESTAAGDGVRFHNLRGTFGLSLDRVSGGPWYISGTEVRHLAVEAKGTTDFELGPGSYEHITVRGENARVNVDPAATVRFSEDIDRLRTD